MCDNIFTHYFLKTFILMKTINKNSLNTSNKIQYIPKKHKAFTLVELIIVITILSILSTIAFISFQNYTKYSRDANRVTTISNIKKWLELYVIKANKYPNPDWELVLTWSINWQVLNYVWEIWESISSMLKTNKSLKDPLTNTNYVYWVSYDNSYYQVWSIIEWNTVYNSVINTTYASSLTKAKVDWNYLWYIKYSSGGKIFIANIPSLLFSNSSWVNLLSSWTYFVLNNKSNLPYNSSWNKDESIKNIDWDKMIQEITKSQNATLTWIDITNLNKDNFEEIFSWATLESFNINWNDLSNTWIILNGLKWKILKSNTAIIEQESLNQSIIPPTNLILNHSTGSKNFTFSWTAWVWNWNCKLQFNINWNWFNINEVTYNCDSNLINQSVTLPWDWWVSSWNSIEARIIRANDSTILWDIFNQKLTCSIVSWSSINTSNIDEDCDWYWDNYLTWVWKSLWSDETIYYWWAWNWAMLKSNVGWETISSCQSWAKANWLNYLSVMNQPWYPSYVCYWNKDWQYWNHWFIEWYHYTISSLYY